MTNKSLYVCTAIPYVNGAPHVGHALDYLLADTYFRYQTGQGKTVRFQAGTDEHGNKIWSKAAELGVPVEDYVTENAAKFRAFIDKLGVHPTDFVRTTDPAHERRCQLIWERLAPHIYQSTYEGWYCSGCERFITENEYKETHGVCPDHQKPYEKLSETNYYFRISDFKDTIRQKIESDELRILPDFRKKEVLHLLADSPDVSISRPRKHLSWGVPVPGDADQVMYVWIDALANYITVLGFPETDISSVWPADVQVVGKDILRFHAIIWPAMLLALNLPLPKTLLSHGHINVDGAKMSKSLGNVVDPLDVLEKYGLDPFRYFFLRHIDTFADSDFTWDKFSAAYTGELANDLGNLVSRLATLCAKNSVSLPSSSVSKAQAAGKADPAFTDLMDNFKFSKAFDYIWDKVVALNKQIDEDQPWALAKTDPAAAERSLKSLASGLLTVATLLAPFLPETSSKISAVFSAPEITPPAPLFPKS